MNKKRLQFDVQGGYSNFFVSKTYLSNVMKTIALKTIAASLFILLTYGCIGQVEENDITSYVETYNELAIKEMERTGIPASIKLAQAILESDAGKSPLAKKANNHFGIKCGDWDGPIWHRKDDDFDSNGKLIKSCFRAYSSVEKSFIDHSQFLSDPKKSYRYGFLFEIRRNDYKKWAKGLKSAGYATNPKYAELLINLIERYKLYQFDNDNFVPEDNPALVQNEDTNTDQLEMEEEELPEVLNDQPGSEFLYNNDVRYILSKQSESVYDVAVRANVSAEKIIKFNEQLGEMGKSALPSSTMVYLQPKRSSYRGGQQWHVVKENETMYQISQQYGLKLFSLYERNSMTLGSEPMAGEKIKLRGGIQPGPPRLRNEDNRVSGTGPLLANESGDFEMDTEFAPIDVSFKKDQQDKVSENTKPSIPQNKFPQYYLVRKGDTLWNIAKKFSIPVDELKKWNDLSSNEIKLGTRLRVG